MSETATGSDAKPVLRTFVLGVSNGAVYLTARAFIDPETLLPAFAVDITEGSVLWVGVLNALFQAGWFWPHIFNSRYLDSADRLMPHYRTAAAIRVVCCALMPVAVYLFGTSNPEAALILCGILLFGFTSAGGFALGPFMNIVGDAVPARWLGKFFGARSLVGGLLAFGAGFWIKHILSPQSGVAFPNNYALVFAAGAVLMAVSVALFWFVKDQPRKSASRVLPLRLHLARAGRLIRENTNLRRLGIARALYGAALGLSFPFVVPYAINILGMPVELAGILLSMKVISFSLSNLLWSHLSDHFGNRLLLTIMSGVVMSVPVATMLSGLVSATPIAVVMGMTVTPQLLLVMVACIGVGGAMSGTPLGCNAMLLEMLPERRSSVFIGSFYIMLLPTAVVPLVGAVIIGANNRFGVGMALAVLVGILMLIQIRRVQVVRDSKTGNDTDG
ncbi:MAG: hypothetical protein R6V19_06265 [Armatimonadota bacterium]